MRLVNPLSLYHATYDPGQLKRINCCGYALSQNELNISEKKDNFFFLWFFGK